jgi:hypothetical protein
MPAAELAATCRMMESAGIDGLFAPQVLGPPWIPLAAAAAVTERVPLGSGIAIAAARSRFETAMAAIDCGVALEGVASGRGDRRRRDGTSDVVDRVDAGTHAAGIRVTHKLVPANGFNMHVVGAGSGFPAVLCHGFPELWYSWRHQLRALADAGFGAIAPDQRGCGDTDGSRPVEARSTERRRILA